MFIKNKKSELNFSESVKLRISTWGATTSCHGVPNVLNSQYRVGKFVWLLLFLVSFVSAIVCITVSFKLFLSNKVETSINTLYFHETKFPTVTICNLNIYNTENKNFALKDELQTYLNKQFLKDKLLEYNQTSTLSQFYKIGIEYYRTLPYVANVSKNQNTLGFNLKEMLLSCEFNTRPCNQNDFEAIYNFHYGLCYQFNADSERKSKFLFKYDLPCF